MMTNRVNVFWRGAYVADRRELVGEVRAAGLRGVKIRLDGHADATATEGDQAEQKVSGKKRDG